MKDIEKIMKTAINAGKIMTGADDIMHKQTEKSGDYNLVTEYDVKVQQYLFSHLREDFEGAKFIGEEVGTDSPELLKEGLSFIIDPIDGTTNFIHDYRISSISIALFKDALPYIGVVYNPFTDEMFYAEAGCGAYLNGKEIQAPKTGLKDNLLGFGTSPYYRHLDHYREGTFDLLKQLYPHCQDLRRAGSAALDICYVACGRQGLFFELILQPYDYAAGSIILTESGGSFTQLDGSPVSMEKPCSILAAGKECHRQFFKITEGKKDN